jgi:hypothetical protein
LLLNVDYAKQAACLKGSSAVSAAALKEKMTGLYIAMGKEVDVQDIIKVLLSSFLHQFPEVRYTEYTP